MIYKDGKISLNADAVASTVLTSIVFESHDMDTARLLMSIGKDGQALPLSALTAKIFMRFSDGSVDFNDATIDDKVDGLISYIIPGNMMHPGPVSAELYLYYANGQILSAHKFTFRINRSMIDEDNAGLAEYYVSDFEKLKTEVFTTVEEIRSVLETVKGEINAALAKFEQDSADALTKFNQDTSTVLTDAQTKINEAQAEFDSIVNDAAVVVNEAKKINIPFLQQAQTEMQGLKKDVSDTNKRMDNIVGNTGNPNTEIVDARLGADGVARGSVGTLIREIHKNTMETEKKTQMLQHGVNVVNASVPSPLNVEIPGRTLVNRLGNKGDMKDSNGDGMADLFNAKIGITKQPEVINKDNVFWQKIYAVAEDKEIYRGLRSEFTLGKGNKYLFLTDCYTDEENVKGHMFFSYLDNDATSKTFSMTKNLVMTQYIKFEPTEDVFKFNIYNTSTVGQINSLLFSKLRIYVIDDAVYNKIDVDPEYSGQKLADKFPYVEGVKHLNPVIAAEGENLFPPFTEWNLPTTSTIKSVYEIENLGSKTYDIHSVSMNVLPNQTCSLSMKKSDGNYLSIRERDSKGNTVVTEKVIIPSAGVEGKGIFTASLNTTNIQVNLYNVKTGVNFYKDLMMNLGSEYKPFTPRNTSYLYTNAVLAGMNGINDVLYKDESAWKVIRKWERDFSLDKLLNWRHNTNFVGYKRLLSDQPANIVALSNSMYAVSPSGGILKGEAYSTAAQSNDATGTGNTTLFITVSNTVSGWGESYVPTADEIIAFLNGWAVKTADVNGKPTAWKSVVDGSDAPTQTIAYVKANKATNYTPYKLTYQLLAPKIEVVQVEGDLVVDGLTQVTIDSGVVVREKATPQLWSENYYINNPSVSALSQLKNKAALIICVYRNGVPDLKWKIATHSNAYGKQQAYIKQSDFDPAAEYTVTYLVLDKHLFTTNVVDLKTTYNQSVRSTIDDMNVRQSDNTTSISIHDAALVEIYKRLKALGG